MAGKNKSARVLVVDDEPDLRELLLDALVDEDVTVRLAASGSEAIRMACDEAPDLLITDLRLGDCCGTEVIDRLRDIVGDVPAVVITGCRDSELLVKASRYRPIELMSKPLDIERLRDTLRRELKRIDKGRRSEQRARRLRRLARHVNIERKMVSQQLDSTCADLTAAYQTLSGQMALQQVVMSYQNELLGARIDDDVFRSLFQTFVKRSGPVFGMALVCDTEAELHLIGRFGVPHPDKAGFCRLLADPLIENMLQGPRCAIIDAWGQRDIFDERTHKFLPGLTLLTMPLMPCPGELIGLVVLYRKGEQPFTGADIELAELLANPTAAAVHRNG